MKRFISNKQIKMNVVSKIGLACCDIKNLLWLKAMPEAIKAKTPSKESLGRFTGSIEFHGETKSVTRITAAKTQLPRNLVTAKFSMVQEY